MTKKNFTSISIVLDRSGSMMSIQEPTVKGFNEFIKTQRETAVGDCVVSLHRFDSDYITDYSFVPIDTVKEMTIQDLKPRGPTALLDAIGKTINTLGEKLSDMNEDERPDTVIVAILTDGEENSSCDFSISEINKLISIQQNDYSWEFVFLGANQDAIATAAQFGINAGNAMSYAANDEGTLAAFSSMGSGLSRKRGMKANAYLSGASVQEASEVSRRSSTFCAEDRQFQTKQGA